MTEMRRVTFSIPDDLEREILNLKKSDEYVRDSYSELVRKLLALGIQKVKAEKAG